MRRVFFFLLFLGSLIFLWKFQVPAISSSLEPFRAVLISDTHLGYRKADQAFQDFLKDVASLPFRPSLLINNGDITEIGGLSAYQVYLDGLKLLDYPALAVIGNHDTRWCSIGKERFRGLIGPYYQSKDFEGIHWMFLDSSIERQPYGHVDFDEMAWIKHDLKKVPPDEPVLTFSHHPFKWRGVDVDNGLDLLHLYQGHNASAFFNGHGHKLEFIRFHGIPFIENDALFHGNYLVLEKTGDEVKLFEKTIGNQELKQWFDLDLHPETSKAFVVSPKLNERVGKDFPVNVSGSMLAGLPSQAAAVLKLDHHKTIPIELGDNILSAKIHLEEPGWHYLDLCLPGEDLPEDEVRIFYPGRVASFSAGEIYGDLAQGKQLIFAGALSGDLLAFAGSGKLKWRKRIEGSVLAPACAHGVVYAATNKGILCALKEPSGKEIWRIETGTPFTAPPLVFGRTLFIGSGDKNVYAFDSKTGKEKWKTTLGDFTEGRAVEANGKIFVGAWDHTFYCLNAKNGEVVWKHNMGKAIYYSPSVARPLLVEKLVCIAGKDKFLHALYQETGKEKWKVPANGGISSPIFANGLILVPEVNGVLAAFKPDDGSKVWEKAFSSPFFNASPVAKGDNLFLVSATGFFFKFDAKEQKLKKSFRVSYGFDFSTPVIFKDKIWIGSLDGHLYTVPVNP